MERIESASDPSAGRDTASDTILVLPDSEDSLVLPDSEDSRSLKFSVTSPATAPTITSTIGADAMQRMVDGFAGQVAILDETWKILAVSESWVNEASRLGLQDFRSGGDYLRMLETEARKGDWDSAIIRSGIRNVISGRRRQLQHVYTPRGVPHHRRFRLTISRFALGGAWFAMLSRCEVTELIALRHQCRRLKESRFHAQEEERRRIGRELHDATAQSLVALRLSLIRLKNLHGDRDSTAIFGEMDEILDQVDREIRAVSYLLHPPPLESGHLPDSLGSMLGGFAKRTGLTIEFSLEGTVVPKSPLLEAFLYRLAQEALANVYRHANAHRASVRLVFRPRGYLHLIVVDDGVGLVAVAPQPEAAVGVGVPGMRERVCELGGRFSLIGLPVGTCLIASIRSEADVGDESGHSRSDRTIA